MIETQYIWKNNQIIPWHAAQMHVLTHGLHYGSAVFEGIRCYATQNGPAIFKLKEHMERFIYSAQQLGMQLPYSLDELCEAIKFTIHKNGLEESYIRPLAYYGYGSMKVVPTPNLPVEVIIACWPWEDYLGTTAVDIVVSPYIRIHPQSTQADAKISGHYVNSILAGLALKNTHYHEALLLDFEGYVAEGSAENIFIVKKNQIMTPAIGSILVGITRNTVIQIAQSLGIDVIECKLTPEDILTADEAFFSGTAVEITPIRSLNNQAIASGALGPITRLIQSHYHKIVHAVLPMEGALTFVSDFAENLV